MASFAEHFARSQCCPRARHCNEERVIEKQVAPSMTYAIAPGEDSSILISAGQFYPFLTPLDDEFRADIHPFTQNPGHPYYGTIVVEHPGRYLVLFEQISGGNAIVFIELVRVRGSVPEVVMNKLSPLMTGLGLTNATMSAVLQLRAGDAVGVRLPFQPESLAYRIQNTATFTLVYLSP